MVRWSCCSPHPNSLSAALAYLVASYRLSSLKQSNSDRMAPWKTMVFFCQIRSRGELERCLRRSVVKASFVQTDSGFRSDKCCGRVPVIERIPLDWNDCGRRVQASSVRAAQSPATYPFDWLAFWPLVLLAQPRTVGFDTAFAFCTLLCAPRSSKSAFCLQ